MCFKVGCLPLNAISGTWSCFLTCRPLTRNAAARICFYAGEGGLAEEQTAMKFNRKACLHVTVFAFTVKNWWTCCRCLLYRPDIYTCHAGFQTAVLQPKEATHRLVLNQTIEEEWIDIYCHIVYIVEGCDIYCAIYWESALADSADTLGVIAIWVGPLHVSLHVSFTLYASHLASWLEHV